MADEVFNAQNKFRFEKSNKIYSNGQRKQENAKWKKEEFHMWSFNSKMFTQKISIS